MGWARELSGDLMMPSAPPASSSTPISITPIRSRVDAVEDRFRPLLNPRIGVSDILATVEGSNGCLRLGLIGLGYWGPNYTLASSASFRRRSSPSPAIYRPTRSS